MLERGTGSRMNMLPFDLVWRAEMGNAQDQREGSTLEWSVLTLKPSCERRVQAGQAALRKPRQIGDSQ